MIDFLLSTLILCQHPLLSTPFISCLSEEGGMGFNSEFKYLHRVVYMQVSKLPLSQHRFGQSANKPREPFISPHHWIPLLSSGILWSRLCILTCHWMNIHVTNVHVDTLKAFRPHDNLESVKRRSCPTYGRWQLLLYMVMLCSAEARARVPLS